MMMESIGSEPTGAPSKGDDSRRSARLILVAGALVIAAVALAWAHGHRDEKAIRQLALLGELQLGARDAVALSSLAIAGDPTASSRLRERSESLQAALAVLANGGTFKDEVIAPAANDLQPRLHEFSTRWAEFRQRTDALAVAAAGEPKPGKEARRAPDKRSPGASVQKAAATRTARGAEAVAAAVSVSSSGAALVTDLDGMRAEIEARTARAPWLSYLGFACAIAALGTLGALGVSLKRSALAIERTAVESKAAVLDGLRPAMRTLNIEAGAEALADPALFGRRLSDEILVVVDGIKALVKALDTATAEADKFAVIGHAAARALAEAEQRTVQSASRLQSTARRIAAVYVALSKGAREVELQCAQVLKSAGASVTRSTDAADAVERLERELDGLAGTHGNIVAMNSEIAQGLVEIADLLTQAEGFALRAADRLAAGRADDAVAFANDVRAYLGPSVTMLKQAMDLVQRHGREADDFSNALAQTTVLAGHQSRAARDAAYALDGVESATHELSAKVASMSRLAAEPEAAQLHSALDDIVRQLEQSSLSARQVIYATKNAASHIEELGKLLSTLKPS